MLASEKTKINGVGYEVTKLPYTPGHSLLLRLTRALGPALGQGVIDGTHNVNLKDLLNVQVGPALGSAIKALSETLNAEDFDYIVDTLAEYTKISKAEGKWIPLKAEMEFHFAGNYFELFQWLGFALKVNYGGFFSEQGIGGLLGKMKGAQRSPISSIGTSTGSQAQKNTQAP